MSFSDVVHATKTALSSDPAQAQAKFEAHHDLVGPCEVTVKVGSGHKFTVDEPEALGAAILLQTLWNMPWRRWVRVRRLLIGSGQLNLASSSTRSRSASMATLICAGSSA